MVFDDKFVIIAIMENSNVVSLLKTFSKKEIKEFDKFLRSPYFTEGKNIRHKILYDHFINLKVFYPEFINEQFERELLFKKLYPGKKYSDVTLRKLNSDLCKLAEKFLMQLELEKDNFKQREYLLVNLSSRKLDNAFLKKSEECYRFLEGDKLNLYYHYNRQLIDILVNDFAVYRQLPSLHSLQNETDNFLLYFLSRVLELYRGIEINNRIFGTKVSSYLMKEVLEFVNENPAFVNRCPLIIIHYYELLVISGNRESDYIMLKSLKNTYADKLDFFGKHNVYNTLESYCTKMIREGRNEYRRELLENDIEMYEKGIYDSSEYINFANFLQKVRNASRLSEFVWAERFISVYSQMLEPVHKAFAIGYARSEISYGKGDYNKALEHVSRISTDFSIGKQWIKNMMIKVYYDTSSYENAYSLIDSARHFITKYKKLPDRRKTSYLDFLKYASNLIDLKINPDGPKLYTLKQKLGRNEYFIEKEWLLEKIAELEENNNNGILQKT